MFQTLIQHLVLRHKLPDKDVDWQRKHNDGQGRPPRRHLTLHLLFSQLCHQGDGGGPEEQQQPGCKLGDGGEGEDQQRHGQKEGDGGEPDKNLLLNTDPQVCIRRPLWHRRVWGKAQPRDHHGALHPIPLILDPDCSFLPHCPSLSPLLSPEVAIWGDLRNICAVEKRPSKMEWSPQTFGSWFHIWKLELPRQRQKEKVELTYRHWRRWSKAGRDGAGEVCSNQEIWSGHLTLALPLSLLVFS